MNEWMNNGGRSEKYTMIRSVSDHPKNLPANFWWVSHGDKSLSYTINGLSLPPQLCNGPTASSLQLQANTRTGEKDSSPVSHGQGEG